MAKIVPEKKGSLTEVKKGKDVTELKFKMSIHGEDMHYPGEMISGCKLMEKCIDACTELSNIRDNGDGGLFVHTEGNILHPVHMLDCVEIIVWLELIPDVEEFRGVNPAKMPERRSDRIAYIDRKKNKGK